MFDFICGAMCLVPFASFHALGWPAVVARLSYECELAGDSMDSSICIHACRQMQDGLHSECSSHALEVAKKASTFGGGRQVSLVCQVLIISACIGSHVDGSRSNAISTFELIEKKSKNACVYVVLAIAMLFRVCHDDLLLD